MEVFSAAPARIDRLTHLFFLCLSDFRFLPDSDEYKRLCGHKLARARLEWARRPPQIIGASSLFFVFDLKMHVSPRRLREVAVRQRCILILSIYLFMISNYGHILTNC
jgi:hypothetical protein